MTVRFLLVKEVAAILRVSNMTIYRLIHSGELKANQFGRDFQVDERDLDEYMLSTRTGNETADD